MSEQTEQLTPYEQGKVDGQWTRERVEMSGFETVAACLSHYEQLYTRTVAGLRESSNPDAAVIQIEYWSGLITAIRETLGAQLMQEEG